MPRMAPRGAVLRPSIIKYLTGASISPGYAQAMLSLMFKHWLDFSCCFFVEFLCVFFTIFYFFILFSMYKGIYKRLVSKQRLKKKVNLVKHAARQHFWYKNAPYLFLALDFPIFQLICHLVNELWKMKRIADHGQSMPG